MLEKIIQVEPTESYVALTWMIGSRCNYECVYCPPELHDMTSTHPDLEKLKASWDSFYEKTKHLNLPYKLSFTGGEVTANKSFLPLMEYLNSGNFNIKQLIVTTNGSASENYYRRLTNSVTDISFSTHSEFFDEAEFFSKVRAINEIMIRPKKSVHVNIMDEWWNKDRVPLYQEWLDTYNISYSVNKINYQRSGRTIPIINGVKNIESI
jgi:MoaA/NifB/PqqE/SkfB family radical SAM enzyme